MAWHVAGSLQQLLAQLNAMAPRRSKTSDGSIGDAAHASRTSDHNPWYLNTVTARDFTHDPANGLDCNWLANTLIQHRDRRIKYIIWNNRIWNPAAGWRPYSGSNPHTKHLHLSVVAAPTCEDRSSWLLSTAAGVRELSLTEPHMTGPDVVRLQRVLAAWYGLPASFADGDFGPATSAYVKRAQAGTPPQPVLKADGVVGPATRRKLGL